MAELTNLFVTISSKLDTAGFDQTIDKIEEVNKQTANLSKGLTILGGAFSAMSAVGVVALNAMANSAGEAELAQLKLNASLKTAGLESTSLQDDYADLSTSLQDLTGYSDEQIMASETLLTQMGIMPSMMKPALDATVDLARALDMDLQSATMLVSKALNGNVAMLGRYGIKMDEAKLKTEGATYVLKELEKRLVLMDAEN